MLNNVSRKLAGVGKVLLERDGSVIPNQARKLCRWEEHFKELLNHAAPPNTAFSAPGEDGVPAEVYKTCLDSLGPWLHRVITKVWLCEANPTNWSEAVLLPLFKKGYKRICSNHRDISWIDIAAKVFGVILLKRFQYERDQRTRPNQSGFGPGRGCTDQMHNLRHTLEQRWNFQQATVMCFVDFDSAFDSVTRTPYGV